MKVKIKKWDMIATWKWYIPSGQDMCGICRSPFEATCAKCKFPGDGCPLMLGTCKHVFHMHCIFDWIRQEASQERCPMCRQIWKAEDAPVVST